MKGRWEPGEETIAKFKSEWYGMDEEEAELKYNYALKIVKGRWEPGEKSIAKSATFSYAYALNVLKGRFQKGEKEIMEDATLSYLYAFNVVGERWKAGEKRILGSARAGDNWKILEDYLYDLCGGEAPKEIEDIIMESTEDCYKYARHCLRGQLPERLHNKMVMLSFSDDCDEWVKKYCSTKKYMKSKKKAS